MDKLPEHLKSQLSVMGITPSGNSLTASQCNDLAKTNPQLYKQLAPFMNPDGSVDMDSLPAHLKTALSQAGITSSAPGQGATMVPGTMSPQALEDLK